MTAFSVESLEVFVGPTAVVRLDRLDVQPGEIAALVGPAGAGKTLLLRGLVGLAPTRGHVVVNQREIGRMRPHERVRLGLSHVAQHGIELPDLLVEDVLDLSYALGGRRSGSRWGRGSAPRPGRPWSMYDLGEHLPGLERVLQADIASVGAWERLAVGIALGLRNGPHVLLLDEPAAGLGDVSLERLRASLRRIAASGVALVIATRNLGLARTLADQTRELLDGRVVAFSAAERVGGPTAEQPR